MRYAHLAFALLAAGCAQRWGPRPGIDAPVGYGHLNEMPPLVPSDPVWIWSNGKVEKWRAVDITPAVVSGIPYPTSLKCDSCRRSIPRSEVDSMKLAPKEVGVGTALGIVGLVILALAVEFEVCRLANVHECG